jgi:hypothetical protein
LATRKVRRCTPRRLRHRKFAARNGARAELTRIKRRVNAD